jgi:hypothetical protein
MNGFVVLPLEQISGPMCMPSRFIIAKTCMINLVPMLRILHFTDIVRCRSA